MKKTFKYLLALAAGTFCLSGCLKEDAFYEDNTSVVTLTAYQEEEDGIDTKAAIDGRNSRMIDWAWGDKINYFGGAEGQYMTLYDGAGTNVGIFRGTVTKGSTDCVLYPYQPDAKVGRSYTTGNTTITAEVPMTQYAVPNSFDPAAALMIGRVNGTKIIFSNVMSYVKVTIPYYMNDCKQVVIKARDAWTTVAGKVVIDADSGSWSETSEKEGQAFVRLVPKSPATALTPGASYYIAILPQIMDKGFELIINNQDVIFVKQSDPVGVEFSRSKVMRLGYFTDYTYTINAWSDLAGVNTMWLRMASQNIGANNDRENGDYFAWGALRPDYLRKTTGSTIASGDQYYNRNSISNQRMNFYGKYAEGAALKREDDIAAMLWGGNWRMPTEDEIEANLTQSAVLALPNAGQYASNRYYSGNGYYWSSTKANNSIGSSMLFLSDGNARELTASGENSYSVRPVLAGPEGRAFVPGKFSVSRTKTVIFTTGNLYCNTTTSPVSFGLEANQYVAASTKWDPSHVRHFYWTKTAAASYAETYDDGTLSLSDKFWLDGSDASHKLTADGVMELYCLNSDEWSFLLFGRPYAGYLCKKDVRVADTSGCLIIACDDYDYTNHPIKSKYTAQEWEEAEALGLLCLPPTGYRTGTYITAEWNEHYWTASPGRNRDESTINHRGWEIQAGQTSINIWTEVRSRGNSLRLVR